MPPVRHVSLRHQNDVTVRVFVKYMSGKTIALDRVWPDWEIWYLRHKVALKDNIFEGEVNLFLADGEKLKDWLSVADYNMHDGTILDLTVTKSEPIIEEP